MGRKAEKDDTRSEKKVKKFRFFKFISISLLILFLLGGLILFENDITIENLRYMVKYLDFSSAGAFSEESTIYYNADSENDFYVFRGDLALINPSGVTLFDRRGSVVMTDSYSMSRPAAVCGEKYLAVYDVGGHHVRVYNSFSLLFEKSFDYPVQAVSINSDGAFCVATSQKNYRSAVFVFNANFDQQYQWLSAEKLATGVYLSDSNELTISAVKADEGEIVSELIELRIGQKKPLSTFRVKGEVPLMHCSEDHESVFLTDRSLNFIENGKAIASHQFPEGSILKTAIGSQRVAVLRDELSVGVNYMLSIFDQEGKLLRSHKFSESIRDLQVYDDSVYVLTHTELFVFGSGKSLKRIELDGDFSKLGVFSEDCVILCGESQAHIHLLDQ